MAAACNSANTQICGLFELCARTQAMPELRRWNPMGAPSRAPRFRPQTPGHGWLHRRSASLQRVSRGNRMHGAPGAQSPAGSQCLRGRAARHQPVGLSWLQGQPDFGQSVFGVAGQTCIPGSPGIKARQSTTIAAAVLLMASGWWWVREASVRASSATTDSV